LLISHLKIGLGKNVMRLWP